MPTDPNRCPADLDQVALDYCDGTLPRADAVAFEDHVITCSRCAAAAEDAERYVRTVRQATGRLRGGGGRRASG